MTIVFTSFQSVSAWVSTSVRKRVPVVYVFVYCWAAPKSLEKFLPARKQLFRNVHVLFSVNKISSKCGNLNVLDVVLRSCCRGHIFMHRVRVPTIYYSLTVTSCVRTINCLVLTVPVFQYKLINVVIMKGNLCWMWRGRKLSLEKLFTW